MGIRVLLADDHALFRAALRMTLELNPDMEVVAEADDGTAVMDIVAHTAVDVVCMDMRMAGLDGLETTRQLLQRFPDTNVIGLSAYEDPALVSAVMAAGARGYVLKMDIGRDLGEAIRRAHRNETYTAPV
ncbi:MAG: response regulator transcription factor [Pseudomonadota bacterium]